MGDVRPLRRVYPRPTPLQFVQRAHDLGEGGVEPGLRRLIQTVLDEEVPESVRTLWRQIAVVDAGISVMLNELIAILELADPAIVDYTD